MILYHGTTLREAEMIRKSGALASMTEVYLKPDFKKSYVLRNWLTTDKGDAYSFAKGKLDNYNSGSFAILSLKLDGRKKLPYGLEPASYTKRQYITTERIPAGVFRFEIITLIECGGYFDEETYLGRLGHENSPVS